MTKAVLEAESEQAAKRTLASLPSPALAVPASLYASLMARLDRLGPAKDVAQIGAAIGREFSHELIGAIARKPEAELKAALDRLIEAGLMFGQGVPPHVTYLFKHALVRDAAYSTLLRTRKQELHRQIVSVLREDFSELVLGQPEMLAHHAAESGMLVEAIEYYLMAAKRATAAMNNKEAKAHLKRGMTLVEQLPATEPRKAKLLTLDDQFHETDHGTGNLLADSSFVVDRTRSGIMAGWRQAVALAMTGEEIEALTALSRSRTEPAGRVSRAAMLLGYREKPSFFAVGRRLGVHHQTVQRCVERAMAYGALAALDDRPRPGKEPTITPEAKAWLVSLACDKAKEHGYPHELWTTRLLARHARERGPAAGHIPSSTLGPTSLPRPPDTDSNHGNADLVGTAGWWWSS